MDNIYITKLLKSDNIGVGSKSTKEITGAIGIDIKKKEIVIFECNSIILATGGYTRSVFG